MYKYLMCYVTYYMYYRYMYEYLKCICDALNVPLQIWVSQVCMWRIECTVTGMSISRVMWRIKCTTVKCMSISSVYVTQKMYCYSYEYLKSYVTH